MMSDLKKYIRRIELAIILMERWCNNKAIFMHKVANGEYLGKISSLFVVKNNDNHYLRNNGIDYTLEKPRINFFKKALVIVVQKCETSCQ